MASSLDSGFTDARVKPTEKLDVVSLRAELQRFFSESLSLELRALGDRIEAAIYQLEQPIRAPREREVPTPNIHTRGVSHISDEAYDAMIDMTDWRVGDDMFLCPPDLIPLLPKPRASKAVFEEKTGARSQPSLRSCNRECEIDGTRHEQRRWKMARSCVRNIEDLVQSEEFDLIVCIYICIYAVLVGLEVDFATRHSIQDPSKFPTVFTVSNHIFSFLFAAEICLRAAVYRKTFFQFVKRNVPDTAAVCLCIFEELMRITTNSVGRRFYYLGIVRISRLFRVSRILQRPSLLTFFRDLRLLVVSVVDSFSGALWSLLVLIVVSYMGAVILASLVHESTLGEQITMVHDRTQGQQNALGNEDDISLWFGSIDRTMLTLFQVVLDGVSWCIPFLVLQEHCSIWANSVFLLFTALSKLVLLNIITSVFVTAALRHVEQDKTKVRNTKLRGFFHEAETNGDGVLSWEEFQANLDNPILLEYFEDLGLHSNQAHTLFRYLDVDKSGSVDIEEFLVGCVDFARGVQKIDLLNERLSIHHQKLLPFRPFE